MSQRVVVFDLETQREFAEVGGVHNRHLLGISVIGAYDSASDAFRSFRESEVFAFAKLLREADLVVGFNIIHFDLPVLQPYIPLDTTKLPTLDLMRDLEHMLGHRVSLDACAEATLGEKKSGHGLEAIQWYRQGKFDLLTKYCLDDVRLTRDLHEYGKTHGQIFFTGKDGAKRAVPVTWGNGAVDRAAVRTTVERALREGRRLEIEYVTTNASDGTHQRNRRKIDVIRVHGNEIDAYCHLRQDTRRFLMDRIVDAVVLEEVTTPGLAVGQHSLL